ncbi:MAG TPA: ATP-binding protein [Anaerolineales bacterium]|nr:ATP-binding protein [Anaerolineales bacterium]
MTSTDPRARWYAGLAGTSLSTRLTLTFGAIVVLTVVAVAAPTYASIRAELERQAWNRVEDGARLSSILLDTEATRLRHVAGTLAERPTLAILIRQDDQAALTAYLDRFREGIDAELVLVQDDQGKPLAWSADDPRMVSAGAPNDGFAWTNGPGSQLLLRQTWPMPVSDHDFTVVAAVWIDDAFVEDLAATTGLEQSILVGGRRLASSLGGAVQSAEAGGSPGTARAELTASGTRYYAVRAFIGDEPAPASIALETALPIDGLLRAENQWRLSLALGTLLVTAGSIGLGLWISHRLTHPLRQLTSSAIHIRQGDLATPVPLSMDPPEIQTLARALDESRIHIRDSLDRLARQKDWSDTLLRSIVEGIVTVDAQGRVTSFSPAAERITGWHSEEVVGRRVDDIVRTADGDPFSEEVPNPGGRRSIRVLHRSGRPLTLATTAASVRPPDGEAAQLALVLRDTTEEESVQSLRSYFLANISHEFRTPLSAINASVELLMDDLESLSASQLRELLDSIHRSVTGLQTLIDNLLESLSIEAGRFSVRRRPLPLQQVIDEAARVMRPLLNRRRQELECQIPAGLPLLSIDPMRITQVLVNLLSNASKYSPVQDRILLSVEAPAGNSVRVSVSDHGEGIPPSERESLFRRFVRLSVSDAPQYGVGLGLSVVKAIVEEHGGQVGVDERPGGGSIFWFTLPRDEGRG